MDPNVLGTLGPVGWFLLLTGINLLVITGADFQFNRMMDQGFFRIFSFNFSFTVLGSFLYGVVLFAWARWRNQGFWIQFLVYALGFLLLYGLKAATNRRCDLRFSYPWLMPVFSCVLTLISWLWVHEVLLKMNLNWCFSASC